MSSPAVRPSSQSFDLLVRSCAIAVATMLLVSQVPLASAQDCSKRSIGQRPLDDLRTHTYAGFEGGLYPGGTNARPADFEKQGINRARRVEPLDANGNPDPNGKIVIAALGFSITNVIFEAFEQFAAADDSIAPAVATVNCARANMDAFFIADPTSNYWTNAVPGALSRAGFTMEQVQVVWLLTGLKDQTATFPDHAFELEDLMVRGVQNVKTLLPKTRLCYVSSLQYQGYAIGPADEEPYYYEQGFAQKWLLERQISGDPELEWDAERGPARAPWLSWGPYFWCDGMVPRSDGLVWACIDVRFDGGHPSREGAEKLGARLLHFLKSDVTTTNWFLAAGSGKSGRPADVELLGDGTLGSLGEPLISTNTLPTVPLDVVLRLQARFASPSGSGLFVIGTELLPDGGAPFAGGTLYVDPAWTAPVVFDDKGAGSLALDRIPDDASFYGLHAFAQLVSFDPAGWHGQVVLSSAIRLELGD